MKPGQRIDLYKVVANNERSTAGGHNYKMGEQFIANNRDGNYYPIEPYYRNNYLMESEVKKIGSFIVKKVK